MTNQPMLVDHDWDNILNSPPMMNLKKSGVYRAKVVETNDPLNINRLRIIVPELHDDDMPPEYTPWACPSPAIGGNGAFAFAAATIGDWVWVMFEKDDPHVPMYIGYANPIRRGTYSIQQIHVATVPVLTKDGVENRTRTRDYNSNYLPKDGRPMSTGYVDKYGNTDMSSAVGYVPQVHRVIPASTEIGGAARSNMSRLNNAPEVNKPDLKYMLRMTKYGHVQLMSDQGYHWYKDPDDKESEIGEFSGDRDTDYDFEAKRWLSVQKLIADGGPDGKDNRRQLMLTRYGHMLDMRDVGWAQRGPVSSKSREGEYSDPRFLSNEEERDLRFVRLRSKGGMCLMMGDKGFHPEEDKFVRRTLQDDLKQQDKELEENWGGDKDARFIALMTRYGWKFVLDDRGSDARDADKNDRPRGLGALLKGRRRPGTGTEDSTSALGKPRGFFFQMVERDSLNSLMLGSPMGHCMEMSDKYQYAMIASTMGRNWSSEWKGAKEHEYNRRPMMERDPEQSAHHMKLDHANEYVRFKTRGGRGPAPIGKIERSGVSQRELQQGIEARDGQGGDGPWVEVVDAQSRGIWMSKNQQLLIIRGKKRKQLYLWINDETDELVIFNGEKSGTIKVYSEGNIELKSTQNITLDAGGTLNLRGNRIHMQAGVGAKMTLARNVFCNARISAGQFKGRLIDAFPGPGAGFPSTEGTENVEELEIPVQPEKIEPGDRGKIYNGPYEGMSQAEVHPSIDAESKQQR